MAFRIESERLYIRPWEHADRPALTRFVNDPDMMRYISFGRVWDEERIDALLARQAGFLRDCSCCVGTVVLKQTGQVVGVGGIQPQDKSKFYEFAWWIWKDYWNRGFATEIARAMVRHAFEVMRLPKVIAIADVPNRACATPMTWPSATRKWKWCSTCWTTRQPESYRFGWPLKNLQITSVASTLGLGLSSIFKI